MKKQDSREPFSRTHQSRFKRLYAKCDNCGTSVDFDNVDLDTGLAACYNCKRFFTVDERDIDKIIEPQEEKTKILPLPEGVDVIETEERLDIRYSQFKTESKGKLVFLTIFNLIWNGAMLFMVNQLLASGDYGPLPFMSLHIITGIVLFVWLASMYLNHVDIIIDDKALQVKKGPIKNPFKEDIYLYPEEIEQLYVEKYVSSRTNGSANYSYKLLAILPDHKTITLVKNSSRRLCLYLEESIERRLGIKDQAIKGEEG